MVFGLGCSLMVYLCNVKVCSQYNIIKDNITTLPIGHTH